jgi:hypothetical protein
MILVTIDMILELYSTGIILVRNWMTNVICKVFKTPDVTARDPYLI